MDIAIVGATGLVGRKMIQVLEEFKFPIDHLYLAASKKSMGQTLVYNGESHLVETVDSVLKKKPAIVLFSAGASVSLEWAKEFTMQGCFVIDNSSAWRMHKEVPLVVPEINADSITSETLLIANPNCSTIQMVLPLAPLHRYYGIQRIVVSTYQSITGTGKKAVQQMEDERNGIVGEKVYPYVIDKNCLPHCDVFLDNGYTKEEMKLVNETRKILQDGSIAVTATAVRVPVVGGHSESVNVTLKKDFEMQDIVKLLAQTEGVQVYDNPAENKYPMPIIAYEKNTVFVGRIRRDNSYPKSLNMWIVADNIRKGAATNAVQIAQYLLQKKLVK